MHGLFITGTDTGVGKTWVTAGLALLLRAAGRSVRACKPVATGAVPHPGQGLLADDTVQLARAAGQEGRWDEVTRWVFADPVAPAVAARSAGVPWGLSLLVEAVHDAARPGSLLLVEGVGGLLCPLTDRETVADLAGAVGLPVVIVARRSLGTLNHTLLTVEAAQSRGLVIAGVVVNETTPPVGLADRSNVEELRQRLTVPLLAVVAHRPAGVPGPLPELAAVDWWQLARSPLSRTLVGAAREGP